jgi:hypothetical protein
MRSRKHLLSLVTILEENVREKRVELSQNQVQRERMVQEYEQLRHMQDALVMAVEVGRTDGLGSLAAESGAMLEAGLRKRPVALDPVANDDAPSQNGSSENGSSKNGGDESEDVRTGLRRVIKKTRSQIAKAGETEEPAPAN